MASLRLPLLLGLASVLFAAQTAQAQAVDVKVKKPNVLLLLDNSGSMANALDGSASSYTQGAGKKARWTILAETLTGTINHLRVAGAGPWVESNGCQPYANLDGNIQTSLKAGSASGAAAAPFTWPRAKDGSGKLVDAVAFCQTADTNCTSTSGWINAKRCIQLGAAEQDNQLDFSQQGDGLLDIYKSKLRFGLGSFDTMDNLPTDHRQSSLQARAIGASKLASDCSSSINAAGAAAGECWGSYACQNAVDGSQCFLKGVWRTAGTQYTISSPQWSYWHSADALDTWLTGGRTSYTLKVLADNQYSSSEQFVDIGIRNSRAHPWRGRLMGFGPSTWNLTQTGLSSVIDCNDEDSCTELHNGMVQQGILGLSRYLEANTPLAAMMRDAYEFILFDKTTKGVHAPHDSGADITKYSSLFNTIGPQTDPFFSSSASCRSTSIVLVTDGEPWEDLDANMSKYADLLRTQGNVRTFVVGLGLDKATWNPTGSTSKTNNVTSDCSTLTAADFGTNRMCERDKVGGRKWKYADVAPFSASPSITAAAIRACCNLVETAVLGGTGRAYFPKDQAELKTNLGQVLGTISGGSVGRTMPVFGGAAASFSQSGGSTKAPAITYEVRSSMDVSSNDTLWRGNIERLRYTCNNADNVSTTEPLESKLGDVFADNLLATTKRARKFFTVIPTVATDSTGTIRNPALAGTDGLVATTTGGSFARLGSTSDTLLAIGALPAAMKTAIAVGTNNPEDMIGLTSSDATACQNAVGSTDLGICAERVLRWFGGDPNPDGGSTVATDPAPSRVPTSAQCRGECSPLGAVYRSVPIFVPPPSVSENDDQNFSRDRTGPTPSFVERYAGRPTMLYSQTVDGMLHAFVVAKNEFRAGAPFVDVPPADELDNNELWSFVPPAVMPSLWKNFNTHARVLDGQMAWANVVYDRKLGVSAGDTATSLTTWSYATVLVGCSGVSAAGPFCYALDVTDPTKPKFLWQLRSAIDATGKKGSSLFGDYVPGAAITHLRVTDPIDGKEHIKAVAIIPGGAMATTPSGVTTRKSQSAMSKVWATTASRQPRSKIRDWGSSALPARSLTFVELSSGRILARMVGDMKDNPRLVTQADTVTQLSTNVVVPAVNTKFDSPLTSIPAVYPGGNAVAERVYVGDADGTLWRVELAGADITKWEAHIAFDAYNAGTASDSTMREAWVSAGTGKGTGLPATLSSPSADTAALMGQPIQTSPTLSRDALGDAVVTFATGDQENFNTYTQDMVTMLVSFPDRLSTTKPNGVDVEATAFQAMMDDETGVEMAFRDGARVTGPASLFDGQLYFSYFVPAGEMSCTFGNGGFCGVDFLDRENGQPVVTVPVAGNDACHDFSQGEVVFGMSVNLAPSCIVKETTFNDPFLSGTYSAMTQATAPRWELVFQTGQGGANPSEGGKTKRSKIQLPNPRTYSQVRGRVRMSEQEL